MKRISMMMLLAAGMVAAAIPLWAQEARMGGGRGAAPQSTLSQPRLSPHDTVSARVGSPRGGALVVIYYGRPFSKDPNNGTMRKIWGTLVPYGQVWRMGADEATLFTTPIDLAVGDTVIPAGAYTLDMQPEADGTAKLIFNKEISRWGIPYTAAVQKDELARVDMKKSDAPKRLDQFTITLTPDSTSDGVTLTAAWENTQYAVDLKQKK